jgi:hypothetical protein
MQDIQTRVIKSVTRLPNTKNGNPRYRLYLTNGDTLLTKPDAQVANVIENSEYLNVAVQITLENGQLVRVEVATDDN